MVCSNTLLLLPPNKQKYVSFFSSMSFPFTRVSCDRLPHLSVRPTTASILTLAQHWSWPSKARWSPPAPLSPWWAKVTSRTSAFASLRVLKHRGMTGSPKSEGIWSWMLVSSTKFRLFYKHVIRHDKTINSLPAFEGHSLNIKSRNICSQELLCFWKRVWIVNFSWSDWIIDWLPVRSVHRCCPRWYIWSMLKDYWAAIRRQVLLTSTHKLWLHSQQTTTVWQYFFYFTSIFIFPTPTWVIDENKHREQQCWYLDPECALENVWYRRPYGSQHR